MRGIKSNFISLLGLSAGLITACNPQVTEPKSPNIIYIFPDQYRNMALGFWSNPSFAAYLNGGGDPVHTPNLNRLAGESLVLSNAMSNFPVSSPHRGCLMTGMYPHQTGVTLNCNTSTINTSLREDVECIGDVFSSQGYECAYIGKYHLDHPTKNNPQHPGHYVNDKESCWDAYTPKEKRHGFNYWYSYGTFDEHKNPHYWNNEGEKIEPKEWSPIHEAKEVIAYLKNTRNQRDTSKPFFMMVGMNPPHTPYHSLKDCMEEDYEWYKNRPLDSLLVRPNVDFQLPWAKDAPFYFASVTGIDRAVGMILDALKEEGLDKNTIVVFTSDHGELLASQGVRDHKNFPFREAMNVPFIVRYPGHIRPRVDNLLLSSPDIMPTMLGLAGLEQYIPASVQGTNYADLFIDDAAEVTRPKGALYIKYEATEKNEKGEVLAISPIARGLKTQRYTLALYIDKEERLKKTYFFDDEKDPYQLNNMSLEEHPEVVQDILKEMGRQLRELKDPWYTRKILNDLIDYGK